MASSPSPARTVRDSRSTVTAAPGSDSSRSHSRWTTFSSTWAASSPALPELPRKMSANREEITTLKP